MPTGSATWPSTGLIEGRRIPINGRSALAPLAALVIMVAACGTASGSDEATTTHGQPSETVGWSLPPTVVPAASETPSPTATPSATPASSRVVLALGDSVTFGVGVPDPATQAFPALVADELGAEARVLAVPGETAAGFLDRRIDDAEAAVAELAGQIEAVTIGLGANEILRIRRHPACLEDRSSAACRRIAAEAAEEAAAALDGVVGRVLEALDGHGSDAPVVLMAYYNPDVEPVASATIVGADGVVGCDPEDPAPGLNDRIACVAARRGVLLVDLYAGFFGREDTLTGIGRGDVHPTVEGHAVIADLIIEALEEDR